ncbi:MAG: hypothetical protein RI996_256, partial [Candidatus Parcubacteria bacterium]
MEKKQTLGGRIPPQDLDAEKALLGSIMLSPESVHDISEIVSRDSFYSEKHRLLYENMLELAQRREPIDIVSVTHKLKEKKIFDSIGGSIYLSELLNSVPSSANIAYYGQIIRKKQILRNLISASNEISELGYSEQEELADTLENAEKKIYSITSVTNGNQKFTSIKDTLDEAW